MINACTSGIPAGLVIAVATETLESVSEALAFYIPFKPIVDNLPEGVVKTLSLEAIKYDSPDELSDDCLDKKIYIISSIIIASAAVVAAIYVANLGIVSTMIALSTAGLCLIIKNVASENDSKGGISPRQRDRCESDEESSDETQSDDEGRRNLGTSSDTSTKPSLNLTSVTVSDVSSNGKTCDMVGDVEFEDAPLPYGRSIPDHKMYKIKMMEMFKKCDDLEAKRDVAHVEYMNWKRTTLSESFRKHYEAACLNYDSARVEYRRYEDLYYGPADDRPADDGYSYVGRSNYEYSDSEENSY
jgi:hypothetical protein